MNLAPVQAIAGDVLYQGFILYPYRPTPVQAQRRWTFGPLYPRAYALQGDGLCSQQTQCLIEGDADTRLEVRVGFLQLVERQPGVLNPPLQALPRFRDPPFKPIERLVLNGRTHYRWHEALEREVVVPAATLAELAGTGARLRFDFDDARSIEPLADATGRVAAVLVRTRAKLHGEVTLYSQETEPGLYRVTVRVENLTPFNPTMQWNDDAAVLHSLASTHTALGVDGGRLVSLIDPPPQREAAAAGCVNRGCFPVLVGDPERCDTLLSSPVILYDFPRA